MDIPIFLPWTGIIGLLIILSVFSFACCFRALSGPPSLKTVQQPKVGEVWVVVRNLERDGPWAFEKELWTVTVVDVKSAWVKYRYDDSDRTHALELSSFSKIYARQGVCDTQESVI